MIIDQLKNISHYQNLSPNFVQAIKFLEETDLNSLPIGRHRINGDNIFANIDEYETKEIEKVEWEAHKKYIDIQILLTGEEKIGYTHLELLQIKKEYNEDKDIMFFNGAGEYLILKTGSFAVFFPHDAHRPGLISRQKMKVKKMVIKVLY
jgi:YhcH/YjgK/YiaL family protein